MQGISVTIIAKNCPSQLRECLSSLKSFVRKDLGDEILVVDTGSTDSTPTVARTAGARVIERPDLCEQGMLYLVAKYLPDEYKRCKKARQFSNGFLSDFARARQIAADEARNDLIFWIDSDDVLVGGREFRKQCAEFFEKSPEDAVFLQYDYSFDKDGACTTVLWRERVLNRKFYHWLGVCHESCVPISGTPKHVSRVDPKVSRIVHKNHRDLEFSDIRNYVILRNAWETSEWKDPRWELYLGNASRGLGRYHEALQWYGRTLMRSGSKEDRFTCAMNCGAIYLARGRPWTALDWFFQAHKIWPSEPRAFYGIARCYFDLKRYDESIAWTARGHEIPRPDTLNASDPQGFDFYPAVFETLSLQKKGYHDHAIRAAHRALEMRPNFEPAKELVKAAKAGHQEAFFRRAVAATLQQIDPGRRSEVVDALDPEVRTRLKLHPHERGPLIAGERGHISILCGPTVEPWDFTSLKEGVGGSEKMLLLLMPHWVKRGYLVDLYGNPKPENASKTHKGVTWHPYESFNPKLERDIVIVWRQHGFLDIPWKARRVIVDLHDVQNPVDYTPERLKKVDRYVFKSDYHQSEIVKAVPALRAKRVTLRNGVDISSLPKIGKRDYQKVVFCSSPDRGLLRTLRIWSRIHKAYPKASLHIYYGFSGLYLTKAASQEYQYFGCDGCDRHMLEYSEECLEILDRLPTAHFHGKVGCQDLAKSLASAGVWLYPTGFPEISCMAAMEAQCLGALPLTSGFAALKETVHWGRNVKTDDEFVGSLRRFFDAGKDLKEYREKMIEDSRARFDVEPLADEFIKLFGESIL